MIERIKWNSNHLILHFALHLRIFMNNLYYMIPSSWEHGSSIFSMNTGVVSILRRHLKDKMFKAYMFPIFSLPTGPMQQCFRCFLCFSINIFPTCLRFVTSILPEICHKHLSMLAHGHTPYVSNLSQAHVLCISSEVFQQHIWKDKKSFFATKSLVANKSCVHSVSFLLLHFCWNCEHLSQGGQVGDKVRILTGQQQAKKLDLIDLDKTEDVRPNKF